jgi:hypothetical protein
MLATMGEGGPTLLQGIQDLFQGFQTWKRLLLLHNPRNTEARHLPNLAILTSILKQVMLYKLP